MTPPDLAPSRGLTPPALARARGVKVDKVHAWIHAGELIAINLATSPHGRPRWWIPLEALADFDRRRSSRPEPPKPAKRRKLREVPSYV